MKKDFITKPFVCKTKTTFGVNWPDLFYSKERLSKPTPVHYNLPSSFNSNKLKIPNGSNKPALDN